MSVRAGWTTCPGCGVELPGEAGTGDTEGGRRYASDACWQLYGEVLGHESLHVVELGRFHQLTVDAYAAQHVGPDTRPIGPAFALIGLALSLEDGLGGTVVRTIHQYLASGHATWPVFVAPPEPAPITVYDVAAASSPAEHADLVRRWAAAVWGSWAAAHETVRALLAERLPADVLARLIGSA